MSSPHPRAVPPGAQLHSLGRDQSTGKPTGPAQWPGRELKEGAWVGDLPPPLAPHHLSWPLLCLGVLLRDGHVCEDLSTGACASVRPPGRTCSVCGVQAGAADASPQDRFPAAPPPRDGSARTPAAAQRMARPLWGGTSCPVTSVGGLGTETLASRPVTSVVASALRPWALTPGTSAVLQHLPTEFFFLNSIKIF